MNEARKTELGNLLDRAVRDINKNFSYALQMQARKLIPISEYKNQPSNKNRNTQNYMHSHFHPNVNDFALEKELIGFIDNELSKHVHNGAMEVAIEIEIDSPLEKNTWNTITSNNILSCLLKVSFFRGIKKAVHGFENLIEEKRISFQYMALMQGIKVESEIQVYNGIRLIPMPSLTSEFPGYLPTFFNVTHENEKFRSKTIISMDYSTHILFNKSGAISPPRLLGKLESADKVVFNLEIFSKMLSLVCNHIIQPSTLWKYYDIDEYLLAHPVTCSRFYPHREYWAPNRDISITDLQIRRATSLYDKYTRISIKNMSMLDVAMRRWAIARQNKNLVDTIIDYGTTLESLYCDENDHRNISAKLSRRAAVYLANSEEEKKALKKTFKKIYDVRSKAVHVGKLASSKKEENEIMINGIIGKAHDLCSQTIIKIIESGKIPDKF